MRICLLCALVFLTACQQNNETDQAVTDNSRTLVTVDEQPITENMVRVFWLNQGVQNPDAGHQFTAVAAAGFGPTGFTAPSGGESGH